MLCFIIFGIIFHTASFIQMFKHVANRFQGTVNFRPEDMGSAESGYPSQTILGSF